MVALAIVLPSSGSPRALGDLFKPSLSIHSSIERLALHVESAGRSFFEMARAAHPVYRVLLPES
jgi:hypothetical protein